MARTKRTARRLPVKTRHLTGWLVNGEYDKKKAIYPLKIKEILPEQKTVNITKDGQMIKIINVRRKFRYFNGKKQVNFLMLKNIVNP